LVRCGVLYPCLGAKQLAPMALVIESRDLLWQALVRKTFLNHARWVGLKTLITIAWRQLRILVSASLASLSQKWEQLISRHGQKFAT